MYIGFQVQCKKEEETKTKRKQFCIVFSVLLYCLSFKEMIRSHNFKVIEVSRRMKECLLVILRQFQHIFINTSAVSPPNRLSFLNI